MDDQTIYVVSYAHEEDYGMQYVPRCFILGDKKKAIKEANDMLKNAKGMKNTYVAISFVKDGIYTSLSDNRCMLDVQYGIKFA